MTNEIPLNPGLEARLPNADPRIFDFFEAWRRARRGRLVPRRRDFDPIAVPGLLRHVWLYQYDPDRADFVCKLAGENVNEAWGRSIRGLSLRQVIGEADHATVLRRWLRILSVPLIHYGAARERLSALELQQAERLLLPLGPDDGEPDHVLGLSLYTISSDNLSRSPLVPDDVVQIPCAEL